MPSSHNTTKLILIDKPKHWTSNDVVRKVKQILKVKKVGHGGTLDPLATGLLILGIEEGTKELNNLLHTTKEYEAIIHFNYETATYDSESEVINYQPKEIKLNELVSALDWFSIVDYYQVPPKFSAIKVNGNKSYDLARKNIDFELKPKLVKLLNYKIISFTHNELKIILEVSKGFYIRSFAHDLGIKLNNYANLANLKRTKIGDFSLNDACQIKDLYDLYNK